MRALTAKWLSPAGFLLAATLFLLLPAVGVSCQAQGGELAVTASGADLATRAEPTMEASGAFAVGAYRPGSLLAADLSAATAPAGVQVLTVLLLAVLVAGVVLGFADRPGLTITAAVAGAGLVVLIENIMAARWRPIMSGYGTLLTGVPEAKGRDVTAEAAAAVRAGFGFWLSLAALVIAGIAVIPALRRKRTDDQPAR